MKHLIYLALLALLVFSQTALSESRPPSSQNNNPPLYVDDAYPMPPSHPYYEHQAESVLRDMYTRNINPQAIVEPYFYCVVYQPGDCGECAAPIGGEGGRLVCSGKCISNDTNCNIRYGRCGESRNLRMCRN